MDLTIYLVRSIDDLNQNQLNLYGNYHKLPHQHLSSELHKLNMFVKILYLIIMSLIPIY